jgi:hypothetical protein
MGMMRIPAGGRHEINMVNITKEGKQIIEKNKAPIMAGITDCAIKHHNCLPVVSSCSTQNILQTEAALFANRKRKKR